ncbi:hypothetical protein Vretifemale_5451 [Volvox reticuliferus]|nr:hypothetical protein Vretifemale_5451 [Volvox reticuliferus]
MGGAATAHPEGGTGRGHRSMWDGGHGDRKRDSEGERKSGGADTSETEDDLEGSGKVYEGAGGWRDPSMSQKVEGFRSSDHQSVDIDNARIPGDHARSSIRWEGVERRPARAVT